MSAPKQSSAPKNPLPSDLPGLKGLKLVIDYEEGSACKGSANFEDKCGTKRCLNFTLCSDIEGKYLKITNDAVCSCEFKPCPETNDKIWYCKIIILKPELKFKRRGIASNIYALAQKLIGVTDAKISPSGQLTSDGYKLWCKLDPCIKFEKNSDGTIYYPVSKSNCSTTGVPLQKPSAAA